MKTLATVPRMWMAALLAAQLPQSGDGGQATPGLPGTIATRADTLAVDLRSPEMCGPRQAFDSVGSRRLPAGWGQTPGVALQVVPDRGSSLRVVVFDPQRKVLRVASAGATAEPTVRLSTIREIAPRGRLSLLTARPDSILLWDATSSQIHVLGHDLTRVGALNVWPRSGRRMELMWLSGTRYSFSQDELIPAAIGDSFNSYIEVGILETPDGRGDVIASIRGHSYGYVNGVRVPLPLSSSSLFAAGGDDLWVLDVDGLTLSRFGPNDAVRRWSLEGIARPNVDDASRKRALQLTYRERSDDTAVQALPVPERMPAFDRMIIDDVGDVWLRRFSLDRNREGSKWYVVGAGSGDVPCAVEFPVGFEVAGFDRGNRIALRSGVDGSPTIEWAARN